MDRDAILAAVNEGGGGDAFQVRVGDSAVKIVRERGGLRALLTIPYEVHELFLEAEHTVSGQKVEDWFDYYGETEEADFRDNLQRFVIVLRECDLRIDERGKTIEYLFGNQWRYFFGHFSARGDSP